MQQDFCLNLRLICSRYRSIADVCRRLGLNRSQFNRYLNGRSKPSVNSLRKICSFFDISEHEIYLSHEKFKTLVHPYSNSDNAQILGKTTDIIHLSKLNKNNNDSIKNYCGYYHEYRRDTLSGEKIVKSLVCMEQINKKIYYQRLKREFSSNNPTINYSKYCGIVHFLKDRIFMNDYNSLASNEITQTILFPSRSNEIKILNGLTMCLNNDEERKPYCSKTVLEYLGESTDKIKALKECRPYTPSELENEDKREILSLLEE